MQMQVWQKQHLQLLITYMKDIKCIVLIGWKLEVGVASYFTQDTKG